MNNFYTPPDKSDINIPDVLAHIRENSLLFTAKNRLYVYNETAYYFAHIPKDELPRFVLGFFNHDSRGEVRTSTLNEIVRRLLVLPETDVNLDKRRKPVVGCKFCIGCEDDGQLIGVAICGRPVSRHFHHCDSSRAPYIM